MRELPPFGQILKQAWAIYRARIVTFLAITIIGLLSAIASIALPVILGFFLIKTIPSSLPVSIPLCGLSGFAGLVWTLTLCLAAFLGAISDQQAPVKELFRKALPKTKGLFWVNLIASVLILGSWGLLIVPGIIFTVWFFFAPFACLNDNARGLDALLLSREYSRGRWMACAWRLLAIWVIMALLGLIPILGFFITLALAPIPWIHSYILYQNLKETRGQFSFSPTSKAKACYVASSLLGFILFPALFFFFLGAAIMGALFQFKSKMGPLSQGAVLEQTMPPQAGDKKIDMALTPMDQVNLDEIAIEEGPAQGMIKSRRFQVENTVIENGVLTLRQGKNTPNDQELQIVLFINPGAIPAGKTFKIAPLGSSMDPHVHLKWKEPGKDLPEAKMFTKGYAMILNFGQETAGKLPGNLFLKLPDEDSTEVSGTFEAEIKGYRLLSNGEPDLTSDADFCLQYAVRKYLEAKNPKKSIEILDFINTTWLMADASIKNQTGSLEAKYKIAGDAVRMKKFQLVKDSTGWRVHRTLSPEQLYQAHPFEVPDLMEAQSPLKSLEYLVAQFIEKDIRKQGIKGGLHSFSLSSTFHTSGEKWAHAHISYKISQNSDPVKRYFELRLGPRGWKLLKEIEESQWMTPLSASGITASAKKSNIKNPPPDTPLPTSKPTEEAATQKQLVDSPALIPPIELRVSPQIESLAKKFIKTAHPGKVITWGSAQVLGKAQWRRAITQIEYKIEKDLKKESLLAVELSGGWKIIRRLSSAETLDPATGKLLKR